MKSKKAQMEEWIPHTIYYLILAVVIIGIIYLLFTGQIKDVWQKIINMMRFS